MSEPQSEGVTIPPTSRLANWPFVCLLMAALLGGLCYYLEEYGHGIFRSVGEKPDYRAEELLEDWCLWIAAGCASLGILVGIVGLTLIGRSESRIRGAARLGIGAALNLLTLASLVFAMFVRALAKAA